MSYIIVDTEGTVKDFSTNAGLEDLEANAPPLLKAFLDSGEITEQDANALVNLLRDDSQYSYIAELLDGMVGVITLSNGVEEDDSKEGEQGNGNGDV